MKKTIIAVGSVLLLGMGVFAFRLIEKPTNNQSTKVLKEAKVYATAKDTELRLTETSKVTFAPGAQPLETEISIFVNPQKEFQEFVGIGGAITDAAAETFAKMPKDKQDELIKAYYSKDGIE
ncbi:MAG: hypothetical protein ABJO02_08325 [Reichenbachiella sp.]